MLISRGRGVESWHFRGGGLPIYLGVELVTLYTYVVWDYTASYHTLAYKYKHIHTRIYTHTVISQAARVLIRIKNYTSIGTTCAACCREETHLSLRLSDLQYSTRLSCLQDTNIQYSKAQCSIVQYSTKKYSTVQYSTKKYSTVQNSTVQYNEVQYNEVQYNEVQYSTVPPKSNRISRMG